MISGALCVCRSDFSDCADGTGVEYDLKPVGKACAATGRPLEPGSLCHSVLVERLGELVRLDFSDEGWTGPPEGAIAEWQALVPDSHAKPKTVDAESLLQHFEQLCEDANPGQDQMRYVTALLLLRKRRLRLEGSRRDEDTEEEYLQFSGSKGEGPYEVRDQRMSEEQIAQLQAALETELQQDEAAAA